MPINPKLKDQLTRQITDAGYRDKLIATLEDAPPEVQNNWMSQEEYTREKNAFKQEQTTWKAAADKFYADSNVAIKGHEAEAQKARDLAAAAQARIAELEAGGGALKTPGQEDAIAKEVAALKTMISGLETKLSGVVTEDKLGQAYQNAVGFMGEQTLVLDDISAEYHALTGKRMTRAEKLELITHANELGAKKGIRVGLDEAFQSKYGADAEKKKIDAAVAAGIEQYKTTHELPGGGSPGPGGSAGPEKGPLEIRLAELRDLDAGKKDGIASSWQEASRQAADELVKEGKF